MTVPDKLYSNVVVSIAWNTQSHCFTHVFIPGSLFSLTWKLRNGTIIHIWLRGHTYNHVYASLSPWQPLTLTLLVVVSFSEPVKQVSEARRRPVSPAQEDLQVVKPVRLVTETRQTVCQFVLDCNQPLQLVETLNCLCLIRKRLDRTVL